MFLLGIIGLPEVFVIVFILFLPLIIIIRILSRGSRISCIRCGYLTRQGGFRAWQIIVSILFFPFGLLSLLAGRAPTSCERCGHTWQT